MKSYQIKGFPDYYVTDTGDVYSRKGDGRFRKLSPQKSYKGYLRVHMYKMDGRTQHKYIHRLVAEAFIPNPNKKPYINHIDGNKENNAVPNLEWCTSGENEIHKRKVLGFKPNNKAKSVIQKKDGKTIKEYKSIKEASDIVGATQSSIRACCLGLLKSTKGFNWAYK